MWVLNRGAQARFTIKALYHFVVSRGPAGEHLHGDFALHVGLFRFVHDADGAGT
jgi:hypothetical protein